MLAACCSIPGTVTGRAPILERYRLNVFNEPFAELPEICNGSTSLFYANTFNDLSVTDIDKKVFIVDEDIEDIQITGWAIDEKMRRYAGGVYVTIDDRIDVPALYGRYREDVTQALGDENYACSGFVAIFSSEVAGKGRHTLSFKVIGADGKGYYVPGQKIVMDVL